MICSKRSLKRKTDGAQSTTKAIEGAPLLVKTQDACNVLGGIHPRTLARLEKRGLIRSVKLLRHKMYRMEDLKALVSADAAWSKEDAQ